MKAHDHLTPNCVSMRASMLFTWMTVFLIVVIFAGAGVGVKTAWADNAKEGPSVLIVDGGLGDSELAGLHWLGEESQVVAEDGERKLTTADNPAWWLSSAAAQEEDGSASTASSNEKAPVTQVPPATFLLAPSNGEAMTADDIAWALDKIRESGAEPRAFVVAVGPTGLSLREYAQDLGASKQSNRADIVGMAFLGTPQNGYSIMGTYPEQTIWEKIAQSAGWSLDDIAPLSERLKNLNGGAFPNVAKSLSIEGVAGDLGFGLTDGAGVADDFALSGTVSDQVESSRAPVTISRQMNLTSAWEPFASTIDYPDRAVDTQLVQRLSAIDSYEISNEVQAAVRDFYRSWYGDGAPVTHISSVLLLDLSGSMLEPIDGVTSKLDAAKQAGAHYLQAMRECSELPQSAPMDVSVFGFNETVGKVTEGYGNSSVDALDGMSAQGETNIGIALDQALAALQGSPNCADKHILLLSDGESTRGMDDEAMLSGPVARAAEAGVVIDAVGFGDVGESDAGFLQKVADSTCGTYYQANDTYNLKVNFLKSYYSSLGLSLVDEEIALGGQAKQDIGAVDMHTSALALGVVGSNEAPNAKLLCNGEPLDDSQYTISQFDGFTSIRCVNPPIGDYTLDLTGNADTAHVFAVKQPGITHPVAVSGEEPDYSLYLLIGAGVLLVVVVAATVVLTLRKSRAPKSAAGADSSGSAVER